MRYSPTRDLEFPTSHTYSHFKCTNTSPTKIVMDDTFIVKYIVDGNWLPNSPQHQLMVDTARTG